MTFIHESIVLNALQLLAVAVMGLSISWGTLLVTRLFRRRSAPFREMILKGGTCLLLGWPVVVLIGAVIGIAMRPVAEIVYVDSVSEATPSHSPGGKGEQSRTMATGRKRETVGTVWTPAADFVASTEKTIQDMLTEPSPEPGMSYTMLSLADLVNVVIIAWGLGLVISLGFLLRDLIRVRRIRQRFVPCSQEIAISALQEVRQSIGLKRAPDLYLSPDLTSPCAAGIKHPVIVLPQSMFEQQIERDALLGVLTHEAAHVKRRDVGWSLLVRLERAVYWWEPGLIFIDRQLSHLREEICDNHVLLAPVDRRVYAKTVLDFADSWVMRPLVGVIGMMGNKNPLSNRIERMLDDDTRPQTRMSRWSWTAIACGGLAAVVCVGLLGVWAERAGAVDPLLASSNRLTTPQIHQANVSVSNESQFSADASPSLTESLAIPSASPPVRMRSAQIQSGPFLPDKIPVEGVLSDNSLAEVPSILPSRNRPRSHSVISSEVEVPANASPDGHFVAEHLPWDLKQDRKIELDLPSDQQNLSGKLLSVVVELPKSQTLLPQLVRFRGFKIAESGESLPGSESDAPRKLTLTGPAFSASSIESLREMGGTVSVAIDTSEAVPLPTDRPDGPQARYRLTLTAVADETGLLKGFESLGRAIPVGDTGPIEAVKAFVANWNRQCADSHAAELPGGLSWTDRLVILNVPDSMRYGEVEKAAMACDNEDVQVDVRSGSTAARSTSLGKTYAAVELTRVYDKQGKPIGQGAILIAHKFGAKEKQIITENLWNQALAEFVGRYAFDDEVLLVNTDADVPLDSLRDLQVRANRQGVEEIQFLTASVPESLEIRSTDMLVPLLDVLPKPSLPVNSGRPVPIYSESDAIQPLPPENSPANGLHKGI